MLITICGSNAFASSYQCAGEDLAFQLTINPEAIVMKDESGETSINRSEGKSNPSNGKTTFRIETQPGYGAIYTSLIIPTPVLEESGDSIFEFKLGIKVEITSEGAVIGTNRFNLKCENK